MTQVAVTGVSGRMGSTLARLASLDPELQLVAVTSRSGAALDVQAPVFVTLEKALESAQPEVVIDFTTAEASLRHVELCASHDVPMVVGTTGFDADAKKRLADLSKAIALVVAPNTSVGVNVVMSVAALLAKALGPAYDAEIVEIHHRLKRDAPSGTALKLAEVLAKATHRDESAFRYERHGLIGERPSSEIGIQTVRGGDVVGEHTVYFFGQGERIELSHRATNRDQFGLGALRAARWVVEQKPGLYGMADVLGFTAQTLGQSPAVGL